MAASSFFNAERQFRASLVQGCRLVAETGPSGCASARRLRNRGGPLGDNHIAANCLPRISPSAKRISPCKVGLPRFGVSQLLRAAGSTRIPGRRGRGRLPPYLENTPPTAGASGRHRGESAAAFFLVGRDNDAVKNTPCPHRQLNSRFTAAMASGGCSGWSSAGASGEPGLDMEISRFLSVT